MEILKSTLMVILCVVAVSAIKYLADEGYISRGLMMGSFVGLLAVAVIASIVRREPSKPGGDKNTPAGKN